MVLLSCTCPFSQQKWLGRFNSAEAGEGETSQETLSFLMHPFLPSLSPEAGNCPECPLPQLPTAAGSPLWNFAWLSWGSSSTCPLHIIHQPGKGKDKAKSWTRFVTFSIWAFFHSFASSAYTPTSVSMKMGARLCTSPDELLGSPSLAWYNPRLTQRAAPNRKFAQEGPGCCHS